MPVANPPVILSETIKSAPEPAYHRTQIIDFPQGRVSDFESFPARPPLLNSTRTTGISRVLMYAQPDLCKSYKLVVDTSPTLLIKLLRLRKLATPRNAAKSTLKGSLSSGDEYILYQATNLPGLLKSS